MKSLYLSAFLNVFSISVATAAPLTVVPGELESAGVNVKAAVDGKEREFQLDFGGATSMVKPDEQTLSYASVGKVPANGAAGKEVVCDLILANDFQFDQVQLPSFKMKRCDLGDSSFNNLGIDVLDNRVWVLDFDKLSMSETHHFPTVTKARPLIRYSKRHAGLNITIDGMDVESIFDTGAQISSVDEAFVSKNPQLFTFITKGSGTDITGNPVQMSIYRVKIVIVGEKIFQDVIVAAFDFTPIKKYFGPSTAFILGNNVITHANWIIDLKNNQWGLF